jgi:hypothetical protein
MLNKARSGVDDLLRGVGVWTLFYAAGGATVVTLVQKYWPQYAPFITTALLVFVAIVVFAAAAKVLKRQRDEAGEWDDVTIQRAVRDWVDGLAGTVTKHSDPLCLFNYEIKLTTPSATVNVVRLNTRPKYVTLISRLTLSGTHVTKFAELTPDQKRELLGGLRIELSRLNLGFSGFASPLSDMRISTEVPITADLSEYQFLRAFRQVTNATVLVRQLVQLRLGEGLAPDTPPTVAEVETSGPSSAPVTSTP